MKEYEEVKGANPKTIVTKNKQQIIKNNIWYITI
jgi:hypothetical protein